MVPYLLRKLVDDKHLVDDEVICCLFLSRTFVLLLGLFEPLLLSLVQARVIP